MADSLVRGVMIRDFTQTSSKRKKVTLLTGNKNISDITISKLISILVVNDK
jgi:hypothetical protein